MGLSWDQETKNTNESAVTTAASPINYDEIDMSSIKLCRIDDPDCESCQ